MGICCPLWTAADLLVPPSPARPPIPSVLITRPFHCPGSQPNVTTGSTTDLRGYEPNEPAQWWDGFRQAIPEFPWGELPQSHSSHTLLCTHSLLPFHHLEVSTWWGSPSWCCSSQVKFKWLKLHQKWRNCLGWLFGFVYPKTELIQVCSLKLY